MTNISDGIAPAHRRPGLGLGLVQIHKPHDLLQVALRTWADIHETFTRSFEQTRPISHWVGGAFHGKRRTSNACARTVTFLHITSNAMTGEIPPSIAEARTRLMIYGHGAFLWTTCAHSEAQPDYVIAFPWWEPGLFPHGALPGNQAAVAEQHAAAVDIDALRAVVIAKELYLDGVLVEDCRLITALVQPATHQPGATNWVAEWVEGGPIDCCMPIIDAKAAALRSTRPRKVRAAYDYLIDIYNEKFPLITQLREYGYQEVTSGRWLSPNQASHSPAITVAPDREHWISFSGSDIAAGVGTEAHSGVRWGDSFSLLKHYECDGRHYRALRLAARRCGLTPPPRRGLPLLTIAPRQKLRSLRRRK